MKHQIDRRTFLAGTGMASAAGMLGACSSGRGSGYTGGSSLAGRNGVTNATPRPGGSIVFGTEAEITSFDPASGRFDETGVMYARTVYDPITIIAADGTAKPYLAQSVVPNADYTVWTITARPGVTFHDGSPCDGPAIAGSMNHFLYGELGLVTGKPIKSVEATGPMTVTVTLNQPWVPFDRYLAGGIGGQLGYVIAPKMIQQIKANPNGQVAPIGTGPFVFKSWNPGTAFVATRNPNYWRSGLPYLDQITYKPYPDVDSRANALEAGQLDIMHTDVAQYIIKFRADQSYGFVDDLSGPVIGEPDMDFLLLNTGVAPTNDIMLRQAIAMAINTNGYKSVINLGLNPVSNQPFVAGTPFYAPVNYPTYNPTKARALVAQFIHKYGHPPTFSVGSTNGTAAVQAAQYVISNLKAVGMNVTLTQVLQDEYINNALSGNFQCYTWRQFGAVDPDLNYIFWSPTTVYKPLNTYVNMAQNADPQIESALQVGRTNTDPAARAQAYQQVAQRFAADLPYIWYDRAVWSIVARSRVQNWNNPTCPDGSRAFGMIVGTIWPTQIWVTS